MLSQEWEVVEKTKPDGTKKLVRRRRIVIVKVVKKPEDLVNENEVTVEEMPVTDRSPEEDDANYDPDVSFVLFYHF